MNISNALKHIAAYPEIYKFVSTKTKTTADIKLHLMTSIGKAESTARDQVSALGNGELFVIKGDKVKLDQKKSLELLHLLEEIFVWSTFDERHELMEAYKDENKELSGALNAERDSYVDAKLTWQKEKEALEAEKQELENQIANLEKKIELLVAQKFDSQLGQKTLLLTSVGISPAKVGLYRDEQFPMTDRHPTIDEEKLLMDTYVARALEGLPRRERQELSIQNWLFRVRNGIFSQRIMEQILEHTGPFKKWMLRYWPYKNLFTAEKLFEMEDKTSTEKYALYILCKGNLTQEQIELLEVAKRSGIHANFVIHILENYRVSKKSKDMLWEVLKQVQDKSEYRMRLTFAQELIEHKWYVTADYCGKQCVYGLVPIEEFEHMQKKLKEQIKQLDKVLK